MFVANGLSQLSLQQFSCALIKSVLVTWTSFFWPLGYAISDIARLVTKARSEAKFILQEQPWLSFGQSPRCDLNACFLRLSTSKPARLFRDDEVSTLRNITHAWYEEPLDRLYHMLDAIRELVDFFVQGGREAASCCPDLWLQSKLLGIDIAFFDWNVKKDQVRTWIDAQEHGNFLSTQLQSFAEFKFVSRLLKLPPPSLALPELPENSAWMNSSGTLLKVGELKILAQLRTVAVFDMRPPPAVTDNNCEGQWCFFEPCDTQCPSELCYDAVIDLLESMSMSTNHALTRLVSKDMHFPAFFSSPDALTVSVTGRPPWNIWKREGKYECAPNPEMSLFEALATNIQRNIKHGCVPVRIAIELICSAADAHFGNVSNAVSRIAHAAIMTTLCADCSDTWQLPFAPSGLWHAIAAAQERVGRTEFPWPEKAALFWWRSALSEALPTLSTRWEGPEVSVCPLSLEDGVVISCRGLEIGFASRFAKSMAWPSRYRLRGCRSALLYGVSFVDKSTRRACSNRTLVLLPHSDLIGHLINGVQWFLPLVKFIHAELGGPENVVIGIMNSQYYKAPEMTLDATNFESHSNPRFFLPLFAFLSHSPILHMDQVESMIGCPSLCFKQAVWGYPQLSTHKEWLEAGRPPPGAAIYYDAVEMLSKSVRAVEATFRQDHFAGGSHAHVRCFQDPRSNRGAHVIHVLVFQREVTRRIANLNLVLSYLKEIVFSAGLAIRGAVVGEGGSASWQSMSATKQMGLARQADLLIGPSGNELGLVAFSRRGSWLLELMPPAITWNNNIKTNYEITNCLNAWDASPGSLVGHAAMRAGVHHACMTVMASVNGTLTVEEAFSPHWRSTPSMDVPLLELPGALSLPLASFLRDVQNRKSQNGQSIT